MIDDSSVSTTEITIHAPAQVVWDVIVDFEHYPLWNDFCPKIEGDLKLGSALAMKVDLGNGLQDQTEYITAIEAPHKIVWSMKNEPGDPIHADRTQLIEAIDETSCTYWTNDAFSGEMVANMMSALGKQIESGFERCGQGLKERAEALYRDSAGG